MLGQVIEFERHELLDGRLTRESAGAVRGWWHEQRLHCATGAQLSARPKTPVLPWPLYAIDFEASSLEDNSYPIEVGIVVWPARDEPTQGWATLIRPDPDWRMHGHWSRASRAAHGIAMAKLADGLDAYEVARTLNVVAQGRTCWCDGGPYDTYWLERLFAAAGLAPAFRLGSWHALLRSLSDARRERALAWLEKQPSRHRAEADARCLLQALAFAVKAKPGAAELQPIVPALADLHGSGGR